jgi:hypothetical protein
MAAVKPDVLYVKFKEDSVFTVSRDRVDLMAKYFQQDSTFVTHFALARLYEDIKSGKYANSSDIPIAPRWLSPEETDAVRKDVQQRFGAPQDIDLTLDPVLEQLLSEA